ncbi:MAG: MBL fold metallo-hydrolase [Spirochaetia bacterium]|jgi:phosphoribosyl 1,2-cyclic phosphodiesterase|nr:MBL fold metallo-hydrolase [Spirochaetia bacterium]
MEIVLTGTAASFNIPAFRCICEVCNQARESWDRKLKRRNSCAVVTGERGEKILIDAPPQFMNQLEQCGIDDTGIDSLLLTHRHEDHVLGLFYMLSLRKSKGGVVRAPLQVYLGADTYRSIAANFKTLADTEKMEDLRGIIELRKIREYEEFRTGNISVTPLETNHLIAKYASSTGKKEQSFGFHFYEKGKNLYYLVDAAKTLPVKTIDFMKKRRPSCVIIDCTYEKADESSGHGDIESVMALRELFPEGRMIISHLGHTNLTPERLAAVFDKEGVEVGYDGLRVVL